MIGQMRRARETLLDIKDHILLPSTNKPKLVNVDQPKLVKVEFDPLIFYPPPLQGDWHGQGRRAREAVPGRGKVPPSPRENPVAPRLFFSRQGALHRLSTNNSILCDI